MKRGGGGGGTQGERVERGKKEGSCPECAASAVQAGKHKSLM